MQRKLSHMQLNNFKVYVQKLVKKGKNKNYWLTGQWHNDVVASKQYTNVVSLNKKAIKPLFLIIYKKSEFRNV